MLRGARKLATRAFAPSSRRALSSAAEPPVLVERSGRIATITLNRPAVLNAMTADMGDHFAAAVHELSAAGDEVGAVVVTGAGKAFSAGGDLDFLAARAADAPHRNAHIMRRFYERFLCVRRLPVPVVAAINGPAVGAGLCLALACDVRVAAPKARMGVSFVTLGLHPGMGSTHLLPALIGPQRAARMLLTGELVTAEQALSDGLVAQLDDDALAAAHALANCMADAAPIAVRGTVRTLRNQIDAGFESALWREASAQAECYASEDLAEGVRALRERRTPRWVGYDALQDVPAP